MPQSTSNFTNAMKDNYGVGWKESVNNANVVWGEVGKNEDDIIGTEAVWSVHSGRSISTGSRGELGTLPSGDFQRHIKPRRGLKFHYHTIKVSGPAKHLTRGSEGAFMKAVELEVKAGEKDTKNERARQAFGQVVRINSGYRTGALAQLNGDPGTGTTLTIDEVDDSVMRHFFVNMKVQAINPADGTVRAGGPYTISAVNTTAKTLTTSAAIDAAVADNDWLVRADGAAIGATSYDNEIDGLRALISAKQPDAANDFDYAGVDVGDNPSWIAVQTGSTTTGVSEVLFDESVEAIETDGDGGSKDDLLFICEHVQRRKLSSILQAQKRYDGRDMALSSGWRGLQLARGVLSADRYCPTTFMFGLDRSEISRFVGLDFQWDEDDDGGVFFKALDGADAIEARFKAYDQLAATVRNAHCQVRVSEPTF